jgi:hypothetical protein
MFLTNTSPEGEYNPDHGTEMAVFADNSPHEALENVWSLPQVTSYYLKTICAFLRSYELPENMRKDELEELKRIADCLEIPAVGFAATERLKK